MGSDSQQGDRHRSHKKHKKHKHHKSRDRHRARSRSKSRDRHRVRSRSKSRERHRAKSRSQSRDRHRARSRSKSRDRHRASSRSKSRDAHRAKSRTKSRDRHRAKSRSESRDGHRARSHSKSRGMHRARSRSKSRDRHRVKSRSKSRDRHRAKSRSKSRDRHRARSRSNSWDKEIKSHSKSLDKSRDKSRDRANDSHDSSKHRARDRSRDKSVSTQHTHRSRSHSQDTQRKISENTSRNKDLVTPVEHVGISGDVSDAEQNEEEMSGFDANSLNYDFDWDKHRYTLDRIFFGKDDYIKRNTKECDDFWAFLIKYTLFQKKKYADSKSKDSLKPKEKPVDKHKRLNKAWKAVYLKMVPQEQVGRDGKHKVVELSLQRVYQFRGLILYYWDFLDKQQKAKEEKIRTDQKNLPIYQYREMIVDTLQKHQVVVVAGDTGCGKSTQVPQYLLAGGFTKIACTQPRRIACISLAKRVSYETFNEYGSEVAHQVRFEKTRTKATRILFLTEGLLLRQVCSDSLLEQYNVLVIDEVHERHIHTDFLLGVVKCLLVQREDLKLILMSATINIELFSGYFDNCPVVKVPGRLYPIELQYVPLTIDEQGSKSERLDPAPYLRILQLIDHKYPTTERGDVLMFLSGMAEIMSVVDATRAYAQKTNKWIILPLHSTLSVAEQDQVFDIAPDGVRKCIISTNIAETSVTIDGVRFVVDSGKVKEMNFDPQYKMQKLHEFWISRASAEQRKGRAGRTGPGKCFRLYAESDYDELQEYSTPEIHRVPLDTLILQMVAMGLPDARKFPYLEDPEGTKIENAVALLKEQGALTPDETLTPIGQMLSQLPVDIVVGKMLIMGSIFQVEDPVLSIAACLSVQSPFTMKAQRDPEAMNHRKDLESDHGDPIMLLNALDQWMMLKTEGRDTRKWCHRRGIEQQRFFEMTKLRRQFQDILQDFGLVDKGEAEDPQNKTREERRQNNINRKRLRDLRMEQRMKGKKRKFLKLEDQDWAVSHADGGGDDLPEDIDTDIKDLEFTLSHDLNKIQEKHNKSRSLTMRDISLLKVILCSGLFPQVAIADEHNSFKPDSEHMFHTKNKGFLLLHPTSVFCQKPELLELREHEVKDAGVKRSTAKGHLSNKHQLLTYVSLLETLKPYVIGCMRVPALQSLLLFSSSLDTNTDSSRILCDGWLEVTFEDSEEGEDVLCSAVKLRQTWLQLLELKLQVSGSNRYSVDFDQTLLRQTRKLQGILSQKLTEFLHHDVYYYIRRVLTAELQHIYIGPDLEPDEGSTEHSTLSGFLSIGGKSHPVKGGTQVNDYLVYNCIRDDDMEYASYLQKHWECDQCGQGLVVTVAERLQHQQQCMGEQIKKDMKTKITEDQKDDNMKGLRKLHHCSVCQKDFNYTTVEILKHNKNCQTS